MTTEEKFRAAVNVIRNLPKNGSYQPSHELMLRFYAYFKQATEGPCTFSKPNFWEVVKKMKWEAWNRLGNMSKEEAMNNYVEELKKIVETMSYNDNVANFLGSLGSFYDAVPPEDLELLIGPIIERVRSQPGSPLSGSPLASREASPHRVANGRITSSLETSPASSYSASPLPPEPDDDEEEEEFIDTVETEPEARIPSSSKKPSHYTNGVAVMPKNDPSEIIANGHVNNGPVVMNGMNGHHYHDEEELLNGINGCGGRGDGLNDRGRSRERPSPRVSRRGNPRMNERCEMDHHDISDQIREAVLHLQRDLDRVTARVRSLEVSSLSGSIHTSLVKSNAGRPSWWPFPDLSPRTFIFVVLWPLFVHTAILWIRKRRANRLHPL